jgi:hypothetical protein
MIDNRFDHGGTVMERFERFAMIAMLIMVSAIWSFRAQAAEPGTVEAAAEPAVTGHEDIAKMITEARTAADHEKIAAYFDHLAADAKTRAKEFSAASDCYRKETHEGILRGNQFARKHAAVWCGLQERHYLGIAQEDKELAKMHRDIAKQLAEKK